MLVLATLEALLPRPLSLSTILLKACISEIVVASDFTLLMWVHLYAIGHKWKLPVRALLIITSAGCVALNAATSANDIGYASLTLTGFITAGSSIILALFSLTALVLVIGFGVELHRLTNERVDAPQSPTNLPSEVVDTVYAFDAVNVAAEMTMSPAFSSSIRGVLHEPPRHRGDA